MNDYERGSYSYYRLHEKIALISLLSTQIRTQQQQQQQEFCPFLLRKRFGIEMNRLMLLLNLIIILGTFSCDNFSCVSSNSVQSKKKNRNINNNNNNNNNNNVQTTDEQESLLEFFIFDISSQRHLNITNDSIDKHLIIFSNPSNSLSQLGIRNGKFIITNSVVLYYSQGYLRWLRVKSCSFFSYSPSFFCAFCFFFLFSSFSFDILSVNDTTYVSRKKTLN